MNHVQLMYGVMNDVFVFAETFKEFPPRSTPPSSQSGDDPGRDAAGDQGEKEDRSVVPDAEAGGSSAEVARV